MSLNNTQIPQKCEKLIYGWIRKEIEFVTPVVLKNTVKQFYYPLRRKQQQSSLIEEFIVESDKELKISQNNTVVEKKKGEGYSVVYGSVSANNVDVDIYCWQLKVHMDEDIKARKPIKIGIIERTKSVNWSEYDEINNFCSHQWKNGDQIQVTLDCENKLLNWMLINDYDEVLEYYHNTIKCSTINIEKGEDINLCILLPEICDTVTLM